MRELGCLCWVMKIPTCYKGETRTASRKEGRCHKRVIGHYVMSAVPHYHKKLYNYHRSAKPLKLLQCLECSSGSGMVNRVTPDELKHGIDDLMRGGNVPCRKSLLAT